jgi:hypothetical protein
VSDTTEYGALIIEQRDGEPYITNAPLPEHIELSRQFWEETEELRPSVDFETGIEPPAVWREVIEHADPDRENDGWMLHVDASNVYCSYRVASVPEDGPVRATLASWSER